MIMSLNLLGMLSGFRNAIIRERANTRKAKTTIHFWTTLHFSKVIFYDKITFNNVSEYISKIISKLFIQSKTTVTNSNKIILNKLTAINILVCNYQIQILNIFKSYYQ